ncbi:MAG: hypothetical protein ABR564_03685 [Candidatus Dormibacteria bacterium]
MSDVDRHLRRRRSAARAPALIRPADIPEDADGRVAFISVTLPEDETQGKTVAVPGDHQDASGMGGFATLASWAGGWGAVGALGAMLVVVFVIGMMVTR